MGAIYNPVSGECFTAAAGQGAWLDGNPIRTSQVTEMSEALAIMGFPPQVSAIRRTFSCFSRRFFCCQGIRRSGSTALNLSFLAAGRYDVFWGFDTKIWDVAAGVLLIREAGGVLCSVDGADYRLSEQPLFAAANPQLLTQLRAIAEKVVARW